jgi:acetolactate synthase-1/2/3 large subunit
MEYLFAEMTHDVPSDKGAAPGATADPKGLEELAGMLVAAKNPVIVAEGAGRTEKSVVCLVEIAELLGAGVVETRSTGCVNFPRAHPLHAGYEPAEYLKDADMLFLLSVIAPWHPASRRPALPGAKVAVLDENPLRAELPYWGYQSDLCLTGEIESSLEELLGLLKKRVAKGDGERDRRAEAWKSRNETRRRKWRDEALALAETKPMDTRWVAHEVSRSVPADAIVVEETITHRLAVHRYFDSLKPGSFFAGCIGGLGTGLSTAIGVKAAHPKRPVVCLIGDGSFNYDPAPAALGAAQEHGLPILIVMFNNQGYLSQKSGVPKYYPNGWAVKSNQYAGLNIAPCPDYATIAKAFDGYGEKVEEPGEVGRAVERGLKAVAAGQLALIDIRLRPVEQITNRGEG